MAGLVGRWLGWTLDAFDFTIFLLIMVPISKEFNVSLTAVTAVFTITCGCACSAPPRRAGCRTGSGGRSR